MKNNSSLSCIIRSLTACVFVFSSVSIGAQQSFENLPPVLNELIESAITNDPYLAQTRHLKTAAEAESIADRQLKDPKINLAYANLPIDTFDVNQEPMTQFQIGISQEFPGGKKRSLKSEQKNIAGNRFPALAANRRADIARSITQLWSRLVAKKLALLLIKDDQILLEQLSNSLQSSYASGLSSISQQDLLLAQLEITRLNEKYLQITSELNSTQALLLEFASHEQVQDVLESVNNYVVGGNKVVLSTLPDFLVMANNLTLLSSSDFIQMQKRHPAAVAVDQRYKEQQLQVQLEKQDYLPDWTLRAQYGYRENNPVGDSRADFLTLGVTFDLPVFTRNRQSQSVKAAQEKASAAQLELDQLLLGFSAKTQSSIAQYKIVNERIEIYQSQFLGQNQELVESYLAAYSAGNGSFSEFLRAKGNELNTQIDYLSLWSTRTSLSADIHYLLTEYTL
ncbi:TolC family protein [Sessilibacter sp. MAH4]